MVTSLLLQAAWNGAGAHRQALGLDGSVKELNGGELRSKITLIAFRRRAGSLRPGAGTGLSSLVG